MDDFQRTTQACKDGVAQNGQRTGRQRHSFSLPHNATHLGRREAWQNEPGPAKDKIRIYEPAGLDSRRSRCAPCRQGKESSEGEQGNTIIGDRTSLHPGDSQGSDGFHQEVEDPLQLRSGISCDSDGCPHAHGYIPPRFYAEVVRKWVDLGPGLRQGERGPGDRALWSLEGTRSPRRGHGDGLFQRRVVDSTCLTRRAMPLRVTDAKIAQP